MSAGDSRSNGPAPAGPCVVLGAGGGIGSEVCRRLHALGRAVVPAGHDGASLRAISGELGAAPRVVDAGSFQEVESLLAEIAAAGQEPAGLVNAVGSIVLKPAHLMSPGEWEDVLRRNLTTAFAAVRAAGRCMRRGGALVLYSSAAARAGMANHDAIAAAKAGVEGLARAAAATYAGRGLRINVVAPGLVDTPLSARITSNPRTMELSRSMHPLGRIGSPGDVAAATVWLLDPAQSWVTGQVLGVDGGLGALRGRS